MPLLGGDGLPMAWREFRRSCHLNPPCDQHEYSRLIESLPEAWLITLRDAVLNRPRPIDWQECVRTSDLPGNAWTCMNDNGQGRRWVAPTQGEAPVFEWMETGELRATTQDETGAPSLATGPADRVRSLSFIYTKEGHTRPSTLGCRRPTGRPPLPCP